MRLVELEGVSFFYRGTDTPSLKNVNLSIGSGEIVALIGASGAGKTTLCLTMAGLIPHTTGGDLEGTVRLGGRSTEAGQLAEYIAPLDDDRAMVAMTFQDPESQVIGMSVEEDIVFGMENLAIPRSTMRERLDWVLEFVGLNHLRQSFPYALSGGQKQRVAIASALVMRPRLLILDEPTSELDPQSRADIYELIQSMSEELDVAVVVVDHSLEDLATAATRFVVMNEGSVLLDGEADTVLAEVELLESVGIRPPDVATIGKAMTDRGMLNVAPGIYSNEVALVDAARAAL